MHRYEFLQRRWIAIAFAGTVAACCAICGHLVDEIVTTRWNAMQLDDLSKQLLKRTEAALDYAVITLADLQSSGATSCTSDTLRSFRQSIAERGAIKNITLAGADGRILCAGITAPEVLFEPEDTIGFPSANESFVLRAKPGRASGIFQVVWDIGAGSTISAALNTDMLMFDVFPAQFRERSSATLLLGGKLIVTAQVSETPLPRQSEALQVDAASSRYPIHISLKVDKADLATASTGVVWLGPTFAGIGGLIISLLVIQVLRRPATPGDRLREALRRREFVPYYQPIFALDNKAIVGCEVLMRWVRNGAFVEPPDKFIPVAESTSLIVAMTRAVVTKALDDMQIALANDPTFKVAINITPTHFVSSTFLGEVCREVDKRGIGRHQLVIEITERQSFSDIDSARVSAKRAKVAGFRLSLDDTGTGHNGLAYVQDLPVDFIKIDKKFIDLVVRDVTARSIVQMLVRLADDLALSTVAEGIETEEQLRELLLLGVTEGQGYLVSPAVPVDRFRRLLGEQKTRKATEMSGPASELSGVFTNT